MDAKTVLSNHWDGQLPVDVYAIAHRMGVEVEPTYALEDGLSGCVEVINYEDALNQRIVCKVNAADVSTRQRFTVAHELGHVALGHLKHETRKFRDGGKQFAANNFDYREMDANNFAAELLMPSHIVEWLITKESLKTVESLSKAFEVSQSAMMYRLKKLGWING